MSGASPVHKAAALVTSLPSLEGHKLRSSSVQGKTLRCSRHMPAPKPDKTDEDATRVPVPSEGFRTESPAITKQLHVQSSSASAPFFASVPV
eukprot:5918889-Amphidinium_carterae.1